MRKTARQFRHLASMTRALLQIAPAVHGGLCGRPLPNANLGAADRRDVELRIVAHRFPARMWCSRRAEAARDLDRTVAVGQGQHIVHPAQGGRPGPSAKGPVAPATAFWTLPAMTCSPYLTP